MLSHQTGVTPGLRTWLLDAVEKGIGIACVAEMISTQYIFGYEVRKRQYEAYCERGSQFNTTSFPAFHEYSTVPTKSLFYMIYKAASKLNEPHFERDRASIQIDYLSMDHTFRVSRKIGYLDSVSGKFIKQYNALCFVMNGKGQIVEYKLTGSTKLSEIKDVLVKIKDRLSVPLTLMIVDNCCAVKNILRGIFGEQLQVKLDLFHAVQRFTSTMEKHTPLRRQLSREYGLVFRSVKDMNKERKMHTPDSKELLSNLGQFVSKWKKHIGTFPAPTANKIHCVFKKIQKHIQSGCLSGIPPNGGTSTNERFHRVLNNHGLLKQNKVNIELAQCALLNAIHRRNTALESEDKINKSSWLVRGTGASFNSRPLDQVNEKNHGNHFIIFFLLPMN